MLAVSPGSITAATSRDISAAAASTASSWVAICISVEGWSLAGGIPARSTCTSRRATGTRSEIRSVGPIAASARSTVSAWERRLACHWGRVNSEIGDNLRSWSGPSATVDTTVHRRRSAVHGWRSSRSRATHLVSHVGRDVRALLTRSAIKVEAIHVQLIGHVGWVE